MHKRLYRLARDSRGATAIEYGLIVTFIVLAIIASLTVLSTATTGLWTNVSDDVVQD